MAAASEATPRIDSGHPVSVRTLRRSASRSLPRLRATTGPRRSLRTARSVAAGPSLPVAARTASRTKRTAGCSASLASGSSWGIRLRSSARDISARNRRLERTNTPMAERGTCSARWSRAISAATHSASAVCWSNTWTSTRPRPAAGVTRPGPPGGSEPAMTALAASRMRAGVRNDVVSTSRRAGCSGEPNSDVKPAIAPSRAPRNE